MAQEQGGARGGPRLTIRLVGFQPGTSQEELAAALGRLYRGRTTEEIQKALARTPLTLTRSATEEQVRKIRSFLEAKGAILEISYQGVVRVPSGESERTSGVQGPAITEDPGPVLAVSRPLTWAKDRRSRPREHRGIPVGPMGLREILGRSMGLLKENLSLFFPVLLLPSLASFLISEALEGLLGKTLALGFYWDSLLQVILMTGVGVLLFLLLFIWAQGALIYAVSEIHLGRRVTVVGSYGAMLRRLWALLSTMLLVWCLVIVGTFFLVLPGVIMFFRWLMADKVVVLEGIKGASAMGRSRELMRFRMGRGFLDRPWVRATTVMGAASLVGLGIYLVFLIPVWALGGAIPEQMGELLAKGFQLAGETLATAFGSIAIVLYYYDIRVRKEGFDHKEMARHV